MTQWKLRSKRKASGGRYHASHKQKARDIGEDPVLTRLATKVKTRLKRGRGGNYFTSLTGAAEANLNIGKKTKKVKIQDVVENQASRHFVRQKVITKGAIIKTSDGLARVTSRPTRDSVINATLLKK